MCFAPQRRAIFPERNFQNGSEAAVFCTFWRTNVFAPQRRAIFPDRNFQNGSEIVVFCAFWVENVLRATAACHFSGSQLPKWLRPCCVLYILTYKCASRHSGVPFFIALLSSSLRTRRFTEPTFRTSGSTKHWKNTAIRDVPNISRTCIFWDLTAVVLWFSMTLMLCYSPFLWLEYCLTWILFDSAFLLCFSTVHIVGS